MKQVEQQRKSKCMQYMDTIYAMILVSYYGAQCRSAGGV